MRRSKRSAARNRLSGKRYAGRKSRRRNSRYRGKRKKAPPSNSPPTKKQIQEPSVEDIVKELDKLSESNRYCTMETPLIRVQLRLSVLRRREESQRLDYDIVQIEVKKPKEGTGTRFFRNMMIAAHARGRGVFIEQCITDGSQGLRTKLIREGLATAYKEDVYGPCSALSVYPPPQLDQNAASSAGGI